MGVDDRIRVQQQEVVTEGNARAALRVYDYHVVGIGGQIAQFVRVPNQNVNIIANDGGLNTMLRVQQQEVVVIAAEGVILEQPLQINAFQYDLDGHIFYGLHVRDRGTFVYDQATDQWTQWKSGDLLYWNAQFHLRWDDEYYAASLLDNQVVRVNPESVLDDGFRVNDFLVTGRLESQSRRYIPNSEVQLFGSVGLRGGEIRLRYSDNDGASFTPYVSITIDANARSTSAMWYDLGSVRSPGRVYEILDNGTMRRIQTLKAKLGSGESDGQDS